MELKTPDVDGSHLHVSSAKVECCNKKILTPTQCSRLRTNFNLKESANKNSDFLVISVAPRSIGQ